MTVKKTKSKELIQIAFYDLLQEKDYDTISIKEICEKAGVSRMSFYRYYSIKEDIFIVIFDESFDRFFHAVSHSHVTSFREMSITFFEGLKKSQREIELLKKAEKEIILLPQFEQYTSYLASKLNLTLLKDGPNPYSIPFFAGALFNVFIRWSNRNYKESPEEMTNIMLNLTNLVDRTNN